MWFETLTGFREDNVDSVADQFLIDGPQITSTQNGRTMRHGRFETPSLGELRQRWPSSVNDTGQLRLREVVADVQDLHTDPANNGAFFQVASQFNTLEMVSPTITPEEGIDRYETDHTQGPACAIACGAGTIYRNYLIALTGGNGQSADRQLNCLTDMATALGVDIPMSNGYALPTATHLDHVNNILTRADEPARDALKAHLRIGVQTDTEVTLRNAGHSVTQAYCSALPIAYTNLPPDEWEPFARLVLDAAYETTLASAIINTNNTGNNRVYLTLLGGGAFGNQTPWILDAIKRATQIFTTTNLDVAIVSHQTPNPHLQQLLKPTEP